MKNLNMDKLSLYRNGLASNFNSIENKAIKEEFKELSYHGEVLERFAEREITNLELLTVVALDVIIENNVTVYENQKNVFYNNAVQSNLLGEYGLFDFVVSLVDNLYNNGKHNLFKLYLKMSEEERMFLLSYLFMRNRVTELKALSLRKIAKEFVPFYTHAQLTENKIEKLYLHTLIFNSKTKQFKVVEDYLRTTKSSIVSESTIEELSIQFGLDKEEMSYIHFMTQLLFQDYFKEKTFSSLINLFNNLTDIEIKKHLGLWVTKYKLKKKMLESSSSLTNTNSAINKKRKSDLTLFTMFFANNHSMLTYYTEDELSKIFYDSFKKENIETLKILGMEDSYVYFLSFIDGRRKNLYLKISKDITTDKLAILTYGNLRMVEKTQSYDVNILSKGLITRIIKKEDFSKTMSIFEVEDDYSRRKFEQYLLKELAKADNFLETFNHYFGEENHQLIVKRFVMDSFSNLKSIKDIKVREFLINETLAYIHSDKIHKLPDFLLFLYKTSNICSKEMFEEVEEAVVYLHDKINKETDDFMYESLNQLFHIEKGNVSDFLQENTPIFNYNGTRMTVDDAKIAIKPFLLTQDSSIILELFKVIIEEVPFNYRALDSKDGFYYFISEMMKMKMSKKLKKMLKDKYMKNLVANNVLLSRGNIEEIEEVLAYLKQLKGE